MKKLILVLMSVVLAYSSCETEGEPVEEDLVVPAVSLPVPVEEVIPELPVAVQEVIEEDDFDPSSITPEMYNTAKKDVQQLIKELNNIIRSRNYNVWVSYLGHDYFEEINSPEFLKRVSESSFLKSKNTVVSDSKDYFTHVVVPSRANSRVDDIEFVSQKRVKAFMVTAQGQRLRLYDLEDFGDGWKIIN
ncbi:hypothetical protein LQZ21_13840 [Treponema sp. TIM-1]|uniref:hypothetical protein n=1 Tax=Treponema sp. TIM-1 TaxID=2898417 RepID=UPI00397F91C1